MTTRRTLIRLVASLAFALSSCWCAGAPRANAQEGSVRIAVAGLTNPRGFGWNAAGELIIAEAGSGGTTESSGEAEIQPPNGPYTGGPTAEIAKAVNGCAAPLAQGLPSAQSATGEVIGVADVAFLGETLYVLVSGGGAAHGNPDQPNGIYQVDLEGNAGLLVDLGAWVRENPVAEPPEIDFDPEGSFFSMAAIPDGGGLWVVESNSEQVLMVTPDGEVSRVLDLSAQDQVPTAIAPAPDGGFYLGQLTSTPFPRGAAAVQKVSSDGTVSTVWSGLTTITGLAVDAEGTLYASQLSTTRARAPFLEPATGSIVRQTGDASSKAVATGLNFPVSLDFGPDGGLYVASPAIGASDGTGTIFRLEPGERAISVVASELSKPRCTGSAGDGTGAISDDAGNATGAGATGDGTGTTEKTPTPAAAASEVIVRILDFGFDNAALTIPVGTTVTWVNTGAVQHTTVALVDGEKYWDSGIMEPGATFAFTFTEPGRWDYVCGLHPDMTGTITVE